MRLAFTVPPNLAKMALPDIAQNFGPVMSAFGRSQNSGQFKLVRGQTALHVLPARSSILERPVSLTANHIAAGNAVRAVIAELARVSGEKIELWSEPFNLMMKPVRVTASSEPAYDVLSRVLAAADSRLSWQLLYDVNTSTYFVNAFRYLEGPSYFPK
jgi:hypothetical protein